MVQVEVPTRLMKEVIKVAEDHHIYSTLDLDSKKIIRQRSIKGFRKVKWRIQQEGFSRRG